ncbi:MAG TPA: LacI family DNA-binding transcriptional regulator [Novosphingobium sp.]|nr:LacI family DNA-binding transcriptional regulator [Novosphingobium sp.]
MTAKRPTLDDVARLVGVSGKTVARVINGEAGVGDATRARVMQVVEQVGYQANVSARALASSRSYRIGILSSAITRFFMSQIYRGVSDVCIARGYQMVIRELDGSTGEELAEFERQLRADPLDGLFVTAPLSDNLALLDMLDRLRIRYVRHCPLGQVDRSDAVFADDVAGASALARHLWELGHRRFGIIRGPRDHLAGRLRHSAFRDQVLALGADPAQVLSVDWERPAAGTMAGFNETARLLEGPMRPTAIATFNDELAAGALAQGHQMGLCLPRDLAVVGYGNADFASLTWPPLTTVRQPNREMAVCAVEWLASAPSAEKRQSSFPIEVVYRASCGRLLAHG